VEALRSHLIEQTSDHDLWKDHDRSSPVNDTHKEGGSYEQ